MQNVILTIDGMDGEAAADRVAEVLSAIAGVSDVRVSLRDGLASARVDERRASPQALSDGLSQAGYPASARAAGGCCGGGCGG